MARLNIDTGTVGNSATGDTLRTAMTKINTNFIEVYDDLAASSLGGLFTNNETNGDVKIQPNGTGIVEVDQLQINNDAITSLITNNDLTLSGNGTGGVTILGTLTTGEVATNEITSKGSNADITLEPQGTGDILLKAGGQVGIGDVSSPDTSLHIKQSTATITLQRTNDANTPGVDFQSAGGAIRAKMYMDGTNGTNKEIVFQTMDGSMEERFRVTWEGANVTGTFNIMSDSDSAGSDATISMTENKITTLRSNDNLEISANGTGKVMMPSNLHLHSATPLIQFQRTDNANVPGISFLGDGGTEGGSIKFDGTDGTTNEIILSSFHSSAVTERLRVTTTGAKVSGTLTVTGATTMTDALTATSLTTNNITSNGSNADITIDPQGTGDINLTSTADINIPTGVGLVFGAQTERIENTSGNNMYIYADTNIYLNAENDIHLDANGGDIALKDNNTKFGQLSQLGGKLTIYSGPTKDDEITLGGAILCADASVKFTNLPTSDPGVAGRLWRSGTDLKISVG